MQYRLMTIADYPGVYDLWLNTPETGNAFWTKMGFSIRADVYYRDKSIHELEYRPNPFRDA